MKNVLAVILGGGRGSRLYPLTKSRSKPAVPLGGSYRLIDIPVSNCINSKISKIFVVTQFNSASLNRHISLGYTFDIYRDGFVDILAAEQTTGHADWYQGTADAVRQNLWHFREYKIDYYLILAGDHLYRLDYRKMIECHQREKADITISAYPVAEKACADFGILQIDSKRRITGFIEKPQTQEELDPFRMPTPTKQKRPESQAKEFLASMGNYVFSREVLHDILNTSKASDFGRDILPATLASYQVKAFPFSGYWQDIGTIQAFYQANLALAQPHPPFRFYEKEAPMYTHPRFLPGSRLTDCTIHHSLVANGCELDKVSLKRCIIGIRSIIQKNCLLEGVVMMGADDLETAQDLRANRQQGIPAIGIGPGSIIKHAIIDKNARIGTNVIIENTKKIKELDGNGYAIRDGIVVVEKNAIIPAGTVI